MPAPYNALYTDLLDLDTNSETADVSPIDTALPTLDFAALANYMLEDNGRQDLCMRPPPASEPPAPVPVPAPVPTIAHTNNAKEIVPDVSAQPLDCQFCMNQHQHLNRAAFLIASYSFKCSVQANVRKEPDNFTLFFFFQPDAEQVSARRLLYFRVTADESWRSTGSAGGRRNCFTWLLDEHCIVHLVCRTPSMRGSLKWVDGDEQKQNVGFLAMEGGCKYTLHVWSLQERRRCRIEPHVADASLSELRLGSPHCGTPPVFDIFDDTPQMSALDLPAPAICPPEQPQARKRSLPVPSFVSQPDPKKPKRLLLNKVPYYSEWPELEPDCDGGNSADCRMCGMSMLECLQRFGRVVSSHSFRCELRTGPKNLRQKACTFGLHFQQFSDADVVAQIKRTILFKVYADSTIRRGKRSLRRNCFCFPIDDDQIVHISCLSPLKGRGSLKWTSEKKQKFLAFETGLKYSIKVHSRRSLESCHVTPPSAMDLLSEWVDDLRSPPSTKSPTSELSSTGSALSCWQLEPKTWNLTMSPGSSRILTIISHNACLPASAPIVVLRGHNVGPLYLPALQYDSRNRSSFIVSIPNVFTQTQIESAIGLTTMMAELEVLDENCRRLTQFDFCFECGLPAEEPIPLANEQLSSTITVRCHPSRQLRSFKLPSDVHLSEVCNLVSEERRVVPEVCDRVCMAPASVAVSGLAGATVHTYECCGDYRLYTHLSQYSHAALYQARHIQAHTDVLLHRFTPNSTPEHRSHVCGLVSRLQGCGVLSLQEIVYTSTSAVPAGLVLEACTMGSLHHFLRGRRGNALRREQFAQLVLALATALLHLHNAGAVQQFTLQNLFVDRDDSGLRIRVGGFESLEVSLDERLRKRDVESLAVVIYQVATLDLSVQLYSHLQRRLDGCQHFLHGLDTILWRCIHANQNERPSANDILQFITGWMRTSQ